MGRRTKAAGRRHLLLQRIKSHNVGVTVFFLPNGVKRTHANGSHWLIGDENKNTRETQTHHAPTQYVRTGRTTTNDNDGNTTFRRPVAQRMRSSRARTHKHTNTGRRTLHTTTKVRAHPLPVVVEEE